MEVIHVTCNMCSRDLPDMPDMYAHVTTITYTVYYISTYASGGGSAKPSLRYLSDHVVPIVDHKWYGLGVQLFDDKDVKVLTSIEIDYRGDNDACCTKMFERWLEIAPNASWSKLISGLRAPSIKLHKLADELLIKLGGCLFHGNCSIITSKL